MHVCQYRNSGTCVDIQIFCIFICDILILLICEHVCGCSDIHIAFIFFICVNVLDIRIFCNYICNALIFLICEHVLDIQIFCNYICNAMIYFVL